MSQVPGALVNGVYVAGSVESACHQESPVRLVSYSMMCVVPVSATRSKKPK